MGQRPSTRSAQRAGGAEPLSDRPTGREEVRSALIDATAELIIEKGLSMSVREIAARAGVNHGLIHTYFDNKEGLLGAAFDELTNRAAAEMRSDGYPPPDLADRRDGELAKANARMMLDGSRDLMSTHPITGRWREALRRDHPEWSDAEIKERVAIAATLAMGWALFSEHLTTIVELDEDQRRAVDDRVTQLVAELGSIPLDAG